MRRRLALPSAALAASVLVIVPALPAAAAASTWTSESDAAWSSATWTGGVPDSADDTITFAGGARSTYDLGVQTFASLTFTNEHVLANGGGSIELTDGLTVAPSAAVQIEILIEAGGDQTWTVGSGGSIAFPAQVEVDPSADLVLDVDGELRVTTGNLDGNDGACITTQGTGIVAFSSGGGAAGTCLGYPKGLVATGAETTFTPGAFLGGTDIVAAGGLVTGGSLADPATVRALSLVAGGTVSPGTSAGTDIGQLNLWGTSAWTGGTYLVDVNGTGDADRVYGVNQAISITDTVLNVRLGAGPEVVPGDTWRIVDSDVAVTGQFVSSLGVPIADGDEFESNGRIYTLAYSDTAVDLLYVRVAPTPSVPPVVPPVVPAAPTLPATGAEVPLPVGVLALAALLTGAGILLGRRRITGTRS